MENSDNELYNTAAELAKQFDKVIGKMREWDRTAATAAAKAASPTATAGAPGDAGDKYSGAPGGRQQPQQQQQQQQQPPPQPQSEKRQQKQLKHQPNLSQQQPPKQQQLVKLLAMLLQQKQQPQLQEQIIELLASYVQEQSGQVTQQKNEGQPEVQQRKPKEQETHEQQQQQQQQQQHHSRMPHFEPQLVATNASNNLAASPQQMVCMEPNALRLVLKLVPSISENGSLILRPSIQEDRADSWNASTAANSSFPTAHQQCNNGDQDEDEDHEDVCVQIDSGAVDCRPVRIAPQQHRSKMQPALHSHGNASQKRVRQSDAGGKQQLSANHGSSGVKRIGTSANVGGSAFPKQQSTELSASRRRRDYPQSGGDGSQMNNHHDNAMGSRGSDCGSFCDDSVDGSSDSDCESTDGLRPADAVEDCDMRQLMEMLQVPVSRSCTAGRY